MEDIETKSVDELRREIREANEAYRTGAEIMSDQDYDARVDRLQELAPNDPLLMEIGFAPTDDSRKEILPIPMASMNKSKTLGDLKRWMRLKGIPADTTLVLTPKYDGISLCVQEAEGRAWTRGDGDKGQRSDQHFAMLQRYGNPPDAVRRLGIDDGFYSFGEVIMPRKRFAEVYSGQFANPRNLVAGKLNDKEPSAILSDCFYIRYGTNQGEASKREQLSLCNALNPIKVPFVALPIEQVTEAYLKLLYESWGEDFQLDGIIVEIDDLSLRRYLGRETGTSNPAYARAYKGAFEEVKPTKVTGITWQVSKQGLLKPVLHVEPVSLDGATVTNVTGNNAKFVLASKLGIGAEITARRSGQVIPQVVRVEKSVETEIPTSCPCCGQPTEWNEGVTEITCPNVDCPDQQLQRIVAFFEIIGVENMAEGICRKMIEAGFDTIGKILGMTPQDMMKVEGFAEKKSRLVHASIRAKLKDIPLSKLQHASGCFRTLGSRKLALVELYDGRASEDELLRVNGFAEKSTVEFKRGWLKFEQFLRTLPEAVTVAKTQAVRTVSDALDGKSFCFTGFRDKDLESRILEQGGVIAGGVTKRTSFLVVKDKSGKSSKLQKAADLGIPIIDRVELAALIGNPTPPGCAPSGSDGPGL